MKKIVISLLALIMVMIIVITTIFNANKDNTAPDIIYDKDKMSYSANCKDSELLKGVEAIDKIDGDVSDLLEVASRTEISKGELEVVEYVACDKKGNVQNQKVVFVINKDGFEVYEYDEYKVDLDNLEYTVASVKEEGFLSADTAINEVDVTIEDKIKIEKETQQEEIIVDEDEKLESTVEPTMEPTVEPTVEPTKIVTPKPTIKPTKEPVKDVKPIIKLSKNEITVKRGSSSTVYLNCIKSISDDKDNSEQLFRKIGMTKTLSLNMPGTYKQGIYCMDSDGNRSNVEIITVHVR